MDVITGSLCKAGSRTHHTVKLERVASFLEISPVNLPP